MDFSNVKWPGFQAFSNRILFFVLFWGALCLLGYRQSAAGAGEFLLEMLFGAALGAFGVRAKGLSGLCALILSALALILLYRGALALFGVHF